MAKPEGKTELGEVVKAEGVRLDGLVRRCFPGREDSGDRAGRMKYIMLSGGKRLRPLLAVQTFRSAGGEGRKIYPFAFLWEILHNFSLVHDDLPVMDDDSHRRGKPTLHTLYGMNAALLTGIDLLCYTFELALDAAGEYELSPPMIEKVLNILTEAAGFEGMIKGQMMDLYWEGKDADVGTVSTIHRLKTARMIEGPVGMGAVLAGVTGERLAAVRDYGLHLGLAYQIADDLLDCRSDFERMGKMTGRDKLLKKATFPSLLGEQESEDLLKDEIIKAREALLRSGMCSLFLEGLLDFILERGTGCVSEN